MKIEDFISILNTDFYAGVPDSLLAPLCNYLFDTYGTDDTKHHVVAANEGNAAAIAAGYHLATGRVPVVYMQNSGEGNIVNPVASLLHEKVYAIPMIFVVGWRGEPGVHDEPQHIYQGEITQRLLDDLGIESFVIDKDTKPGETKDVMDGFSKILAEGRQVAFIIKKGAFTYDGHPKYKNQYSMNREEVIRHIARGAGDGVIISTTGKASRELFEIREETGEGHGKDFLTVGSMGHGSSIALGVAAFKPDRKVWCIDGDGAVLMHMGAMAVIGSKRPSNFVHIVINNAAHETVGGLPTVAGDIDISSVAKACGYSRAVCVCTYDELDAAIADAAKSQELTLIEARCALGARSDLGRPTTTPAENKLAFMRELRDE